MKILFTSTAGLGHLYPLLPLARAARDAHHQVLFAVPVGAVEVVRRLGFSVLATSDGDPPRETGEFWKGLAGQSDANTYVFAGLFGRLRVQGALERTRSVVEDYAPELVISECLEFAGSLVAESHGIPQVSVGVGSLGLSGLRTGPLVDELNRWRSSMNLPAVEAPPWQRHRFATWLPDVLQGAGPGPVMHAVQYRYEDAEPTGSLSLPSTWLRPRVYATLGSAAPAQAGTAAIYRAVLAGLAECEADILFSIGSLDPATLGPVPSNVTVMHYAAQRDAMSADAVVSHGGSGTTVATLAHGLPSVTVPLFADQPHNAAQLQAAGLGVTVEPRNVTDELPAAVARVLDDASYRRRAQGVAASMALTPTADDILAGLVTSAAAEPVHR